MELGPEPSLEAALGIGKVLRILRVARIAVGAGVPELAGDLPRLLSLLERAVGTELRLVVRRRSRLHFLAWTEAGPVRLEDVSDVEAREDAVVVMLRGARLPRRFPRDQLIRQRTERESWLEVVEILRPE